MKNKHHSKFLLMFIIFIFGISGVFADKIANSSQELANKTFKIGWYFWTTPSKHFYLAQESQKLGMRIWEFKTDTKEWIPLHNATFGNAPKAGDRFSSVSLNNKRTQITFGDDLKVNNFPGLEHELHRKTWDIGWYFWRTPQAHYYLAQGRESNIHIWQFLTDTKEWIPVHNASFQKLKSERIFKSVAIDKPGLEISIGGLYRVYDNSNYDALVQLGIRPPVEKDLDYEFEIYEEPADVEDNESPLDLYMPDFNISVLKPVFNDIGLIDIELLDFEPVQRNSFDFLILADSSFVDTLKDLKEHKEKTGLKTEILSWQSVVSRFNAQGRDDPERIKKAIYHYYTKFNIRYVALVGDSDKFPIRFCRTHDDVHWGDGWTPSDLYYSDIVNVSESEFSGATPNRVFADWDKNSNNLFCEFYMADANAGTLQRKINIDEIEGDPDLGVSRIPVSTVDELKIYINKIISYEFNAYHKSWINNMALIATVQADGDSYKTFPGATHSSDAIYNLMKNNFNPIKFYDPREADSNVTGYSPQTLIDIFDSGYGVISHIGHGGEYGWPVTPDWFSKYNVHTDLDNYTHLPIVFSAGCDTARFYDGNNYLATDGTLFDVSQECPSSNGNKGCLPAIHAAASAVNAPEPAALQNDSLDAMAEYMLVKQAEGAIAYIGGTTGVQYPSQLLDRSFFNALLYGKRFPLIALGDVWKIAMHDYIRHNVDLDKQTNSRWNPNFNNDKNIADTWMPPLELFHMHKMMMFGDPSLRINGVKNPLIIELDVPNLIEFNPIKPLPIPIIFKPLFRG